jgi:photosystem II stability/assembly factor-like uncharacterized protein
MSAVMRVFKRQLKFYFICTLVIPVISVFFFKISDVYAHTPHDIIDVVELSPQYDQDNTLFIARSYQLKKSTDGGYGWKDLANGLDNLSNITSIAVSPSFLIDKTLFISTIRDGIYKSQDSGSSWIKVNGGLDNLSISLISVSPLFKEDGIVLAAGSEGGLYKTKNKGTSWYKVNKDIAPSVIAFLPSPVNNRIIIGDHGGNLFYSTDKGETWKQLFQISDSGAITSIAISPVITKDDTFFAATEKKGILKTDNNGTSLVQINNGIIDTFITSVTISPEYEEDTALFACGLNEAVYRSHDGGESWEILSKGITKDAQANTAKFMSPNFIDLKISESFKKDSTLFLGGFDGLFKSTDRGQVWTQLETLPLKLVAGLAVSPGTTNNSALAITTYGGGAYTTYDQGINWTVNNYGLKRTRLSDIEFSPDYENDNLLISSSRGYLLTSAGRENMWNRVPTVYSSWRKKLYGIAKRLKAPDSLLTYVKNNLLNRADTIYEPFATDIEFSPAFSTDKTVLFATRVHGIYKYIDG